MNTQKTLWGTFATAVKETPKGFFKPAVAAFCSFVEPMKARETRETAPLARTAPTKNRKK